MRVGLGRKLICRIGKCNTKEMQDLMMFGETGLGSHKHQDQWMRQQSRILRWLVWRCMDLDSSLCGGEIR
jgi:hypothetical protein